MLIYNRYISLKMNKSLSLLLLPILSLMLYAGLNRKGYDPSNNLHWEKEGGLTFEIQSMVYTDKEFPLPLQDEKFSLELIFRANIPIQPSFQVLLLISDGNSLNQLVIGQWGKSLVLMNGSDYSNRRRTPKLYIPLDEENIINRVCIKSGPEETLVYVNSKQIVESKELVLHFPPPKNLPRMILGNNILGNNPWTGTLYNLSMESISCSWNYDFSLPFGEILPESNGTGKPLLLPPHRPILIKHFLHVPHLGEMREDVMQFDMLINFIGFIPLGCILYFLLKNHYPGFCLIIIIFVFFFSLFLETLQGWIPSRDSSLLDLLLNTLGGSSGMGLAAIVSYYKKGKPSAVTREKPSKKSRKE